jgi:TetR/AcrR family transcriptional regulator, tetracycline repressor protein
MATGPTRTQPRGFLSRDLIIQQAFALLDEHGPGALSMRRLADHLGVAPNALYTHVRSKADLVDGLIDQVYAGIDLDPDPSKDWTDQLAAISNRVRAQFLAHPAVVPYALQQPGLGPNSLRLGEAIYGVLRPAGFSDQATVGIVYALLTYILGFVALEIPRAGTDPRPATSSSAASTAPSPPCPRASSPTPSSSPPCWQGSPPTTSSSSASGSSWPASKPSNRHPTTRSDAAPSRQSRLGTRCRGGCAGSAHTGWSRRRSGRSG